MSVVINVSEKLTVSIFRVACYTYQSLENTCCPILEIYPEINVEGPSETLIMMLSYLEDGGKRFFRNLSTEQHNATLHKTKLLRF
jgi:hypothetical protein